MGRTIRLASLTGAAWLIYTAPAFAQTLNIGTGIVGSSAKWTPGAVAVYSIGSDVPLSERWSVRFEVGRRLPGGRTWQSSSKYYLENPAAPGDPRRAFEVSSLTTVNESSIADASVLLRFGTPRSRPVQIGALAGLDLHVVDIKSHTLIPQSITDPSDVFESSQRLTRVRGVFDIGTDAVFRVDDRWAVTVYGLAGLQSPLEEHRGAQLRAGVLAQYRF